MLRLRAAIAALSGVLVFSTGAATVAEAGPSQTGNWYVSVFGGWTLAEDHEIVNSIPPVSVRSVGESDDGYSISGAVGMIVSRNLRVEVEVAHSQNDYDDLIAGVGRASAFGVSTSGELDVTTVMVNGWIGESFGSVSPYIGGGIGVGFVDSSLSISSLTTGPFFDGDDTGFAAQVGAGLRFPVGMLELDVGYRLKSVFDVSVDTVFSTPGVRTSEDDIVTQTVQAGATLKF